MKHKSEKKNKAIDVFRKTVLMLATMKNETIGFNKIRTCSSVTKTLERLQTCAIGLAHPREVFA